MKYKLEIRIIRKLFLLLLLFPGFQSLAQTENEPEESIVQKEWGFKTPEELVDTAWWALQRKTNAEFMSLLPTLEIIKATFDSLDIKKNPQIIKIKYNNIYFRVSKQLKFLNAKARANKLKFKTCEKDNVQIKQGKDDKGNVFAYVTINCHKGKRVFAIKFVALKLLENWYVLDELKLEFPEDDPYYKIPEKIPIKIKRK